MSTSVSSSSSSSSTSSPSTTPPPSSHPGTLHFIPPNLSAFEPSKPLARTLSISTLLWIGGLNDTYLSVSYPSILAQRLPPTWSLMTLCLTSSGTQWGIRSISDDAAEIASIVSSVRSRRPGGKIVLMGHSTGCQDCVAYISGPSDPGSRPGVEGVILQAPVSDREALEMMLPAEVKRVADLEAERMCAAGEGKEVLKRGLTGRVFGDTPISARRWVDVSSPAPLHLGKEDFFSSDLGEERLRATFGRFPRRTALLVLVGGEDEAVPGKVDKGKLVEGWLRVVKEAGGSVDEVNSGVLDGASHNLNLQAEEVVQGLVKRVVGFVERLDRGEIGGSDDSGA